MKPSPCPAPMGPAVTRPFGHSLDSTFLLLRTHSVITHSRTHSSGEHVFSGCCCAKPCAGCLEYVSEQDRRSELSRGTVFSGPGIWHVFLPLSFSGQGCDQVARDSLMAGRGPCSFLAIRPVRALNSNPVPSRRPRVHTSEKPATADVNQRAPKCRPGPWETREAIGGLSASSSKAQFMWATAPAPHEAFLVPSPRLASTSAVSPVSLASVCGYLRQALCLPLVSTGSEARERRDGVFSFPESLACNVRPGPG